MMIQAGGGCCQTYNPSMNINCDYVHPLGRPVARRRRQIPRIPRNPRQVQRVPRAPRPIRAGAPLATQWVDALENGMAELGAWLAGPEAAGAGGRYRIDGPG